MQTEARLETGSDSGWKGSRAQLKTTCVKTESVSVVTEVVTKGSDLVMGIDRVS